MAREESGIGSCHERAPERFWNYDEAIGEGRFFEERATIRLKAHVSEERYHRAGEVEL